MVTLPYMYDRPFTVSTRGHTTRYVQIQCNTSRHFPSRRAVVGPFQSQVLCRAALSCSAGISSLQDVMAPYCSTRSLLEEEEEVTVSTTSTTCQRVTKDWPPSVIHHSVAKYTR